MRKRFLGSGVRRLCIGLLLAVLVAGPALATEITRVQSKGGIEAWLVREPSIPIVALEVAWRDAGAKLDPVGKSGLANLVSGLLDEGAGELDSQAFQSRLEELAISIGFAADRDEFRGSLRTQNTTRDEAFRLFGLALAEPRFDAEPLERVRRQTLSRLTREEEDPDALASRALMAALFPEHPYGNPTVGTLTTLPAIQRQDVVAFPKQRLARSNMVIGVVGDIAPEELGPLLDRTFGGLGATPAPATVAAVEPAWQSAPLVITKGIPQSVVQFAGPGVLRNDPDYYAAYVMNYVLGGGGFNSRLMEEVREKRGLVYGISAYLVPLRHVGLQLGNAATENARVADTVRLIREEFRRMAEGGLDAAELATAKTFLNGSFPLRLSSNARIANMLVAIQLEELGIDFIDKRSQYINAVTLEDVRRVAKRLLDPEKLTVVVVGQPVGLGG